MNKGILVLSIALLAGGVYTNAGAQNAPDNSGVNVRDRGDNTLTAGDQSNSKADLHLTAAIRRAIVKDGSLSMMAHNIKIISTNGAVTLRGPVKSDQEKEVIASKAQAIAGADKVDNQLEVASQ
jgi:osmotically-inducible protein OsmY